MALISMIQNWFRTRNLREQLRALSDHQLEDIGLCRADIPA
ncbi:MAG: DUF1127 domain-containing protein [Pseudomonadota bacterium]